MLSNLCIWLLIPTLLSWVLYKYLIFPLYISPLSRIPPIHPTSPLSSLWIRYQRRGGRTAFRLLLAAHKKHGPIIRIGPSELSVASLDGLRKIYLGGFEKSNWYVEEFTNYETPNLVSMLSSKPHATQKRMLSHVYSKSYVQNSSDLKKVSQVILRRWISLMRNHGELAISPLKLNQALGADFTTAYLFGLGNGSDFLSNSKVAGKYFDNWKIKMKGLAEKARATKEIEAYLMNLVQRAEWSIRNPENAEEETKPIVYEQLSKGLENSGLGNLVQKESALASEMLDHTTAGSETVRVTLTFLQYKLSRRPELQKTLRHELLQLSPQFKFATRSFIDSEEFEEPLTFEDGIPDPKALDALPILDSILKETLRLYPPTPALLTRIVPKEGTVIEGYEIPGGMTVGTSGYVMHMNEDIFPDATSFKPERWQVDSARKAEMMRWFWVFGSGGRMCIGSHFAIHSELPD